LRKELSWPNICAELWSLSVEGPLPAYAAIIGEVEEARIERENYFKAIEDEAERIAKEKGVELKTKVAYGHPADVIIRFAEERNFDLIILAHKGHTLADRFLLGSTSDKVADHSKSSVLIVK